MSDITGNAAFTSPDLHVKRRADQSPFDWTPQPGMTLFVAPDEGVRKTPDAIAIPMPHHTVQTHGCESVPYQELLTGQTLHNLTRSSKAFFRALLAPTVKHV